jgi:rare lipoprotein A
MKQFFLFVLLALVLGTARTQTGAGGNDRRDSLDTERVSHARVLYGTASYYADKFNGRQTANGDVYNSQKMTAACNVLPLGTWIRVTNLVNNRSVIVRTNDRLHIRMKRLVDLSHVAAEKLGYLGRGLTKVKVEVLEKK